MLIKVEGFLAAGKSRCRRAIDYRIIKPGGKIILDEYSPVWCELRLTSDRKSAIDIGEVRTVANGVRPASALAK